MGVWCVGTCRQRLGRWGWMCRGVLCIGLGQGCWPRTKGEQDAAARHQYVVDHLSVMLCPVVPRCGFVSSPGLHAPSLAAAFLPQCLPPPNTHAPRPQLPPSLSLPPPLRPHAHVQAGRGQHPMARGARGVLSAGRVQVPMRRVLALEHLPCGRQRPHLSRRRGPGGPGTGVDLCRCCPQPPRGRRACGRGRAPCALAGHPDGPLRSGPGPRGPGPPGGGDPGPPHGRGGVAGVCMCVCANVRRCASGVCVSARNPTPPYNNPCIPWSRPTHTDTYPLHTRTAHHTYTYAGTLSCTCTPSPHPRPHLPVLMAPPCRFLRAARHRARSQHQLQPGGEPGRGVHLHPGG
jgi:hypothetical protein